jgi:hypothetical protein
MYQVWNMNSVNGVLGIFNLQGYSWDRKLRGFKEPEKPPPEVVADARPSDIEHLESPVGKYAVWSNMNERLFVLGQEEKVREEIRPLSLAREETRHLFCHQRSKTRTVSTVALQIMNRLQPFRPLHLKS